MDCLKLCGQMRKEFSGNVFPKYLLFKKTTKQKTSHIVPVVIRYLLNYNLIFVFISPQLATFFMFVYEQ